MQAGEGEEGGVEEVRRDKLLEEAIEANALCLNLLCVAAVVAAAGVRSPEEGRSARLLNEHLPPKTFLHWVVLVHNRLLDPLLPSPLLPRWQLLRLLRHRFPHLRPPKGASNRFPQRLSP